MGWYHYGVGPYFAPDIGRVLALAMVIALAGCSGEGAGSPAGGDEPFAVSPEQNQPSGEVTVFAAASLTDVFKAIAADFEKAHPGVRVELSFAGSQSLRTQISNGAQPEVFASANPDHLHALAQKSLADPPQVFAHGRLVVVVPASNPAKLKTFEDIASAARIVLAGESVPAGAYANSIVAKAAAMYGDAWASDVHKRVVSREPHVRQSLHKVALGEADAAMVYATDARAAGDRVKVIEIPASLNVEASYPVSMIRGAARRDLGELFLRHLLSESGQSRLLEHGFMQAREEG